MVFVWAVDNEYNKFIGFVYTNKRNLRIAKANLKIMFPDENYKIYGKFCCPLTEPRWRRVNGERRYG